MCDGEFGETIRKSMDILVALGDIYGASKLVDITSAQVSGVSYKTIGDVTGVVGHSVCNVTTRQCCHGDDGY